jgi:lipopolysaccharide transport system permease protein
VRSEFILGSQPLTTLTRHYVSARRSYSSEVAAAGGDFIESFRRYPLWLVLAVNDVAARYRGSLLGPIWITVSTAAFVVGIGLVYGQLMHVPTDQYVPWMATGIVIWNMITMMITEGGDAFVAGSSIIKQTSIPLPLFIWRVIARNILNFAHQIIVIFAVAIWFHYIQKINILMVLIGFLLVCLNLSWITFLVAMISARFRDFQQIIQSILQLLFFISPVIWIPRQMSGLHRGLLELNPAAQLLVVLRNPSLGLAVPSYSLIFLLVMGALGWIFSFGIYSAVRRRIVHFL